MEFEDPVSLGASFAPLFIISGSCPLPSLMLLPPGVCDTRAGESPPSALLGWRGLPGGELGLCNTKFQLELMGRCVDLGLPLRQRAFVCMRVQVCEMC